MKEKGAVKETMQRDPWNPGRRELRRMLTAAMPDLPIGACAAFWLYDVEGLSNGDTARALGISVAAVKSRVRRSRLGLRRLGGRPHGRSRGTR